MFVLLTRKLAPLPGSSVQFPATPLMVFPAVALPTVTVPTPRLRKQYQRLFEMEDVSLTITQDAYRAIARKAIERKTGARGLRSIMEAILLDTMFELPGLKGVEEVVIGPEVVDGGAKPLRIYSERAEEKGSSA